MCPPRYWFWDVSGIWQNADPFSCSLTLSVPAAVTNLRITENSSRYLSFGWTASEGELSWYNTFLYNPDRTLQERAQVDPLVQRFSFQNLLQGRMYKMVIVTHSGELSNESFIFGRTGKTQAQTVRDCQGGVTVSTGSALVVHPSQFCPEWTFIWMCDLETLTLTQTRYELCLLILVAIVPI